MTRPITRILALTAAVTGLTLTPSHAQDDDCTVCGRETGFKPAGDRITEGKTLLLDVISDCIDCGRETGFLPRDTWSTVAFHVEKGLFVEVALTPTSGAAALTTWVPSGDVNCVASSTPKLAQSCTFEAKTSGTYAAEVYALADTALALEVRTSEKPF